MLATDAFVQDRPPAASLDAHPIRPLLAYSTIDRLWLADKASGGPQHSRPEKQAASLSFSRDGYRLWGVIDELQVVSWSLSDLTRLTTWEYRQRENLPGRIGISCLSAGSTWVVADRAGLVHVLRATDGQLEVHTQGGRAGGEAVALSPDESLVACGTVKGGVSLIRHEAGENCVDIPSRMRSSS